MANSINSINLLPHKGDSLMTQFLTWALSVGRLLIIVTETLALSVFVYRFSLDMHLVDLHDAIKSDSFVLDNFQSAENNFRDLQTRLSLIKTYEVQQKSVPAVFKDIVAMGKDRVTFQALLVSPTTAKIAVDAKSIGQLSAFVSSLRQYPAVKSISVDKVEDETESAQINVAITATLADTNE